eukprot:917073-Pelagomonas_calceolata.AAC.7
MLARAPCATKKQQLHTCSCTALCIAVRLAYVSWRGSMQSSIACACGARAASHSFCTASSTVDTRPGAPPSLEPLPCR